MPQADAAALQPVLSLLRQLREIKGVREVRPGVFQVRGAAFINFLAEAGALHAELKKPGGSGFDRFALDTSAHQRKLVDEARLRAALSTTTAFIRSDADHFDASRPATRPSRIHLLARFAPQVSRQWANAAHWPFARLLGECRLDRAGAITIVRAGLAACCPSAQANFRAPKAIASSIGRWSAAIGWGAARTRSSAAERRVRSPADLA